MISARHTSKSVGKKIPFVGLAIGAGFGIWRSVYGDYEGACLEVASGAASTIPGVGTAASLGVDAILAGIDINASVGELKVCLLP